MLNVSRHIILWIISLSILNSSVDATQTYVPPSLNLSNSKIYQGNDLQGKDQAIETIVELVLHSLNDTNVPDSKNNEQQSLLKKPVTVDFSLPVKKEKLLSPFIISNANNLLPVSDQRMLPTGFIQVFSPPPDKA